MSDEQKSTAAEFGEQFDSWMSATRRSGEWYPDVSQDDLNYRTEGALRYLGQYIANLLVRIEELETRVSDLEGSDDEVMGGGVEGPFVVN